GEQFRAIIQRSSDDPVTQSLDRSGYVTILDVTHTTDAQEAASRGKILSWLIPVAEAGEKPADAQTFFRYPYDTNAGRWYTAQDLGTKLFFSDNPDGTPNYLD